MKQEYIFELQRIERCKEAQSVWKDKIKVEAIKALAGNSVRQADKTIAHLQNGPDDTEKVRQQIKYQNKLNTKKENVQHSTSS